MNRHTLSPRSKNRSGQYQKLVATGRRFAALLLITAFMLPVSVPARHLSGGQSDSSTQSIVASAFGFVTAALKALDFGQDRQKPLRGRKAGDPPQDRIAAAPVSKAELEAKVARIEVNLEAKLLLQIDETIMLAAIPLDKDGNVVQGLSAQWESSDQKIVSVTPEGKAVARKAGTALLIARSGSVQENREVTVTPKIKGREGIGEDKATLSRAELAHAGNPMGPLPQQSPEEPFQGETLSVDQHGSVYWPENQVGSPSGMTTPGASTPPAATSSGSELPGSANFSFSVPVVGLPGRGLNLSLALVYNSRLWNKTPMAMGQMRMSFNVDKTWPAPGFTLGFGSAELIIPTSGTQYYNLIDPDGTRHKLLSMGSGNFVSTDGTFIKLQAFSDRLVVTYTNGTKVTYEEPVPNGKSYVKRITDRNGNYIEIAYVGNKGPRISKITDTLGRDVNFNYDTTTNDLISVTAPGYDNSTQERQLIRFYYQTLSHINQTGSWTEAARPVRPLEYSIRVPSYIYFPGTESGYGYDYSEPYGVITRITEYRKMQVSTTEPAVAGTIINKESWQVATWTEYNYPTTASNLSDAPTYTRRTDDWAGRTAGMPVTGAAPYYTFAVDKTPATTTVSTVTAPSRTVTKSTSIKNPGQWDDGLLKEVEITEGGALLSRTNIDWGYWEPGDTDPQHRYNQRQEEVQITNNNNQTRKIAYEYYPADATNAGFNNIKTIKEYGFDNTELRKTEFTYKDTEGYENQGLVHLVDSVIIYPGGSTTPAAKTVYEYDVGTLDPRTGITMLDTSYNNINERGNVTKVKTYADPTSTTSIDHTMTYDVAGNVVTQTVDCCRLMKFEYSSTNNYAYQTKMERGDAGQLSSTATYDKNTGLVKSLEDENGLETSFSYNPATLRLTQTTRPDDGYTSYEYKDELISDGGQLHSYVKTTSAIDSTREVSSWQYMDGRGAVARVMSQTPDGYATTDIQYDLVAGSSRTSNPYYASTVTAALNPSDLWTTTTYDGLGRVKTVTTPDGNVVSINYTGSTTNASAATVTDQAGRQRRQLTDALGRVIRVDEPNEAGQLGTDINSPAQPTSYLYDVLGNLTKITQGVQTREFKYDSLGQLIRQKQAEARAVYNDAGTYVGPSSTGAKWSDVFVYSTKGKIKDAYDARQVHAEFQYNDGLDRLTDIIYSDGTPNVKYTYDQVRSTGTYYNAGRLTEVATLVSTTNHTKQTIQAFDYDKMGRVVDHNQTIDGSLYNLTYKYNLMGALREEKYPSGKVMAYEYDAAARLSAVKDAAKTYSSSYAYYAHGGLKSESFNNGAVQAFTYNNRLQVEQIKLTLNGTERQRYDYKYGEVNQTTGAVTTSKNTGQVASIEGFIDGAKQWQQRMSYDTLGRLTLASEYRGDTGQQVWQADYDYDKWGNRLQLTGNQNVNISFIEVKTMDIDQTTNRFTSATDFTYDDAGYLKVDKKFRGLQYQYDANGRMKQSAQLDGTGVATAIYDGLGQRVQTVENGVTRKIVFDAFGQMVAEYGGEVTQNDPGGTKYLMSDHQGSARVVMNANTNAEIISRRDYRPFGEKIDANVGMRDSNQKYSVAESTRQQYAELEKDKSELDHATWRKYDNSAGRWTSPDPYSGSMDIADPQSMNRYAYVVNDPVNFVDPGGLDGYGPVLGNVDITDYDDSHVRFIDAALGSGLVLRGQQPLVGIAGASASFKAIQKKIDNTEKRRKYCLSLRRSIRSHARQAQRHINMYGNKFPWYSDKWPFNPLTGQMRNYRDHVNAVRELSARYERECDDFGPPPSVPEFQDMPFPSGPDPSRDTNPTRTRQPDMPPVLTPGPSTRPVPVPVPLPRPIMPGPIFPVISPCLILPELCRGRQVYET